MISYRNFQLVLADYNPDVVPITFSVRVQASPAGPQWDNEASQVEIPKQLAEQHKMLQRRGLDEEQMIEFGEELAKLLLPPTVRHKYFLSRAKLKPKEGLRIQICTNEPKLAALPWEYIYVWAPDGSTGNVKHAGFLALDREISIVRYQLPKNDGDDSDAKKMEPGSNVVKIGALLSDGREAGHQQLDMVREGNNLEQALMGVDGAELKIFPEGKLGGILDWLTKNDAQVFHFAGHGTIEKEPLEKIFTFREERNLVALDENGKELPWDDGKVAMALHGNGIRLVVLNACDSGGVGPDNQFSGGVLALVEKGIPAVVGMQFTVRDANAIAFSHQFYLALASGKSIDTAVSEGRHAIFQRPIEFGRDWGVPVLYLQTDIALFPKPVRDLWNNLILLGLTLTIACIWLSLHVFPLWTEAAENIVQAIGFTAGAIPSLLLAFKLWLSKAFEIAAPREQSSRLERVLRHPQTKWGLRSAFVVVLGLTLTTGSLYLNHPVDQDPVSVYFKKPASELESQWKKLRTDVTNKLDGGPVFLLNPMNKLELEAVVPEGFELKGAVKVEGKENYTVSLSPFWSKNIELVEKPSKPMRILRLVPGPLANQPLPIFRKPIPEGKKSYNLIVTIDERKYPVTDIRRDQVVWLGEGSLNHLQKRAMDESDAERAAQINKCGTDNYSENFMVDKRIFIETDVINQDSKVSFRLENVDGKEIPLSNEEQNDDEQIRNEGDGAIKLTTEKTNTICITLRTE